MKHYNQPKTQVLQVMNNSIICASGGPAPAPARVSVTPVTKTDGTW
ncbi:MAG: hypothetical protein MJZ88_00820 [Paludibacteraceae bacterium]|nr:hypothetical protein [Paludibacteraceae bacterium]